MKGEQRRRVRGYACILSQNIIFLELPERESTKAQHFPGNFLCDRPQPSISSNFPMIYPAASPSLFSLSAVNPPLPLTVGHTYPLPIPVLSFAPPLWLPLHNSTTIELAPFLQHLFCFRANRVPRRDTTVPLALKGRML